MTFCSVLLRYYMLWITYSPVWHSPPKCALPLQGESVAELLHFTHYDNSDHKFTLHAVHSFISLYDWQYALSIVWGKQEYVVKLVTLQQNACVLLTADIRQLRLLDWKSHLLGMLWRDFLHGAEGWISFSLFSFRSESLRSKMST